MIYEITDPTNVSSLFDNWEETLIWSCLQGIMGKIYADDLNVPTAAMAMLGDFTFLLESQTPNWYLTNLVGVRKTFMIMVPQNNSWQNTILQFYQEKGPKIVSPLCNQKKNPIVLIKKS